MSGPTVGKLTSYFTKKSSAAENGEREDATYGKVRARLGKKLDERKKNFAFGFNLDSDESDRWQGVGASEEATTADAEGFKFGFSAEDMMQENGQNAMPGREECVASSLETQADTACNKTSGRKKSKNKKKKERRKNRNNGQGRGGERVEGEGSLHSKENVDLALGGKDGEGEQQVGAGWTDLAHSPGNNYDPSNLPLPLEALNIADTSATPASIYRNTSPGGVFSSPALFNCATTTLPTKSNSPALPHKKDLSQVQGQVLAASPAIILPSHEGQGSSGSSTPSVPLPKPPATMANPMSSLGLQPRPPPGLTLDSWRDPALTEEERRRRRFGKGVRNMAAIQRSSQARRTVGAGPGVGVRAAGGGAGIGRGRLGAGAGAGGAGAQGLSGDVDGLSSPPAVGLDQIKGGSSVFEFGFDIGISLGAPT